MTVQLLYNDYIGGGEELPINYQDENLFTAEEAAQFLGYSEAWFHRHIKDLKDSNDQLLLKPRSVPGYKHAFYEEQELRRLKASRRR